MDKTEKEAELNNFLKIIRNLHETMSVKDICQWLQKPIPTLENNSPLEYINQGHLIEVFFLVESYKSDLIS